MKKIFKNIVLTTFIALSVLACSEDFLEMNPPGSLGDAVAITSLEDFKKAVNGAHADMMNRRFYDGQCMLEGDLAGDDFLNPVFSSNWLGDLYDYERSKVASNTDVFEYGYSAINNINNVLVKGEALGIHDDDEYKHCVGQLRTIRALFHFEIVKRYGPLPSTLGKGSIKADALGIMISDEVIEDPFAEFKRDKVTEVYSFIITELKAAIPLMNAEKRNGYITQDAAKALLARVSLYNQSYDDALSYSEELINSKRYPLYSKEEYVSVWGETYTSESIFEVSILATDNNGWNSLGNYCRSVENSDNKGYREVMATKRFLELVDARPNDVRSQLLYEDIDKEEGFFFPSFKYPGRDGDFKVNNPKVFRISEMYLIAAEAALLKSSPEQSKVDAYINILRTKRIGPDETLTNVTIDDILDERRMELFAEGHRGYDLRRHAREVYRWADFDERNETEHHGEYAGLDNGIIPFDYYRNIYPIPERELELMAPENQRIEQNPGY